MSSSVVVLLVVAAAALTFGFWRRATDGRVREQAATPGPGVPLGQTATLVQFSSAVCAPCATTRRVLTDICASPGVEHVEIDVEQNRPLVEQFDITRTPTVLLLDHSGEVRRRVVGVPRRAELHAAIADLRGEYA